MPAWPASTTRRSIAESCCPKATTDSTGCRDGGDAFEVLVAVHDGMPRCSATAAMTKSGILTERRNPCRSFFLISHARTVSGGCWTYSERVTPVGAQCDGPRERAETPTPRDRNAAGPVDRVPSTVPAMSTAGKCAGKPPICRANSASCCTGGHPPHCVDQSFILGSGGVLAIWFYERGGTGSQRGPQRHARCVFLCQVPSSFCARAERSSLMSIMVQASHPESILLMHIRDAYNGCISRHAAGRYA